MIILPLLHMCIFFSYGYDYNAMRTRHYDSLKTRREYYSNAIVFVAEGLCTK